MLNYVDVVNWTPLKVRDWLIGLSDDVSWLKQDVIISAKIGGKELLMLSPMDLEMFGAVKVGLQELILEAIENLRFYNFNMTKETLQTAILRLACQSRGLHRQLVHIRAAQSETKPYNSKNIMLSSEFRDESMKQKKQRVSLDTLANVSNIVTTVKNITGLLSSSPFSEHGEYRSMKSLLLALSIELTSTAQRDQFVERPNDIIEKSSKALADYCDRIVHGTKDILLIQPLYYNT